jgi:XisI protein/XisH protein
MPRRDVYHEAVINALRKDGWTITHDPLILAFGRRDIYPETVGVQFAQRGRGAVDRMMNYHETVKRIIKEYAALKPYYGEIEVETVFDEAWGHYEMVYAGWDEPRRIHGTVIHVDIRGDKIWIQHDGTEDGLANELMAAGVPASQIVLAFHPPDQRKLTPFAVG